MQNLPAVPSEAVDPKSRHVEFRAMQCQTCGEFGPAISTDDKDNPGHVWDPEHARTTSHHDFYAWTLTRNIAWSGTIGDLQRGKGRK